MHRQQPERVEVSVFVGGDANAQVDVRLQGDGVAALADHTHFGPFADCVAPHHSCRGELKQRHRIAVGCRDGERVATTWHDAGERDIPGGRCQYDAAEFGRVVDPAVLAARVRVRTDGEGP